MKKKKDHVGRKIKRLRAYRGMSQEQLANSIGKTRSLISHIERTGKINKYTLNEIASALESDSEEFELNETELTDSSLIFANNSANEKNQGFEMLIKELKSEISYLKGVINQQWELIKKFEESKK